MRRFLILFILALTAWAGISYAQEAGKSLVFCVFGDTRPDGDARRLAIVTKTARAMATERPAVVLGLGDYVDGARTARANQQQYEQFLKAIAPLQSLGPVGVGAAVGNHDLADGGALFRRTFARRYYSFNIAQCHFIILDTEEGGHRSRIEGAQWEWLQKDLEAAQKSRLIFVALHQPLFPVSVHRGHSLDQYPKLRDRLHAAFVYYNVNCVFAGHEHLYHHERRDEVDYFISAGAGAPLYAKESNGGFYHYLRVDVRGDQYTVTVRRVK